MKISKSGSNYKIKCSEKEYNLLKYAIYDINDYKDNIMKDFVLATHVEDMDIDDIARVMKGTE